MCFAYWHVGARDAILVCHQHKCLQESCVSKDRKSQCVILYFSYIGKHSCNTFSEYLSYFNIMLVFFLQVSYSDAQMLSVNVVRC